MSFLTTCAVALLCGIASAFPVTIEGTNPIKRANPNDPEYKDCSSWSSDQSMWTSEGCVKYTPKPLKISGATVSLFHYYVNWVDDAPHRSTLTTISDAAAMVLPEYSQYVPNMVITILLTDNLGTDVGLTRFDGNTCVINILEPPDTSAASKNVVNSAVAHELYHCVEHHFQNVHTTNDFTRWWKEGACDYFDNYYYPELDPKAAIRMYNPTIPLYSESYSAALFFTFLSNSGWKNRRINNWVAKQEVHTDAASERAYLSGLPELVSAFPEFAKAFEADTIKFHDGSLVHTDPSVRMTPVPYTPVLNADGDKDDLKIEVAPFAMIMYTATLNAGQTVTMEYKNTHKKNVLNYRKTGDLDWLPLTTTTVKLGCHDAAVTYEFLFTSTANKDLATAHIIFTRLATNHKRDGETCQEDPPETSDDSCLIGNWALDLDSMQSFLAAKMQVSTAGTVISNLKVGGVSTFDVHADNTMVMTYDKLDISYNAANSGMMWTTDIIMSGTVTGAIVNTAADEFTITGAVATGEVDTTTTTSVSPVPLTFNLPISDGYTATTVYDVKYACTANTLELVGTLNGAYSWAYSYKKA